MIEKFKNFIPSKVEGNTFTPAGRLVYPHFFKMHTPKGEPEDKARYQTRIIFPADADMSGLEEIVAQVIEDGTTAKFRKENPDIRRPLARTETVSKGRFAELADEFPWTINCKNKIRPDVLSPNGRDVFKEEHEADEVYSGRWARLSVQIYFWNDPKGGPMVLPSLQNVQLLDHDEPIAGGRVKGIAEFDGVTDDGLEGLE